MTRQEKFREIVLQESKRIKRNLSEVGTVILSSIPDGFNAVIRSIKIDANNLNPGAPMIKRRLENLKEEIEQALELLNNQV